MKLDSTYTIDGKVVFLVDNFGDINIYRSKTDDEVTFYLVDSNGNVLKKIYIFVGDYDPASVEVWR